MAAMLMGINNKVFFPNRLKWGWGDGDGSPMVYLDCSCGIVGGGGITEVLGEPMGLILTH